MSLKDAWQKEKIRIEEERAKIQHWEKPFESEQFNYIFKIIYIILNSIIIRYINVLLLFVVISAIIGEWSFVLPVLITYVIIKILKFGFNWFYKNYKKIKIAKNSEGVTFIEMDKFDNNIQK